MVYLPNERGQCLVEVIFIALFGAIVTIFLLALTGPAIGNVFSNIVTTL
jgi:pilus assembly protein Flp/PilA